MMLKRLLFSVLLVSSMALISGQPEIQADTIAFWDFETIDGSLAADGQQLNGGAFTDASGNGNDLFAYSPAGYFATANIFGNTTLSADKDAVWDGLHTDAGNGVGGDLIYGGGALGAMDQWTIEADVNFAASDIGNFRTIVGQDGFGGGGNNGGDTNAAGLYFQKSSGNLLRINFVDAADNRWLLDGTSVLTAETWYNLKAVSDGSTVSIFVDNVLESTLDISNSADSALVGFTTGTGNDGDYQWSVGRGMYNNSHGDKVDGFIDNVRISNAAVPEPSSISLLLGGLMAVGLGYRNKRS